MNAYKNSPKAEGCDPGSATGTGGGAKAPNARKISGVPGRTGEYSPAPYISLIAMLGLLDRSDPFAAAYLSEMAK